MQIIQNRKLYYPWIFRGIVNRSFFIVAPCILIYVEFSHQQMHIFI